MIKYRVWDRQNKRFSTFEKDKFHVVLLPDGELRVQTGTGGSAWAPIMGDGKPRFVIQQFTSLLDKKGKEIYEGDIVLWRWGTSSGNVKENSKGKIVRTGNGRWVIHDLKEKLYTKDNNGYPFDNDFRGIKQEREKEEIVGNIFQNRA